MDLEILKRQIARAFNAIWAKHSSDYDVLDINFSVFLPDQEWEMGISSYCNHETSKTLVFEVREAMKQVFKDSNCEYRLRYTLKHVKSGRIIWQWLDQKHCRNFKEEMDENLKFLYWGKPKPNLPG